MSRSKPVVVMSVLLGIALGVAPAFAAKPVDKQKTDKQTQQQKEQKDKVKTDKMGKKPADKSSASKLLDKCAGDTACVDCVNKVLTDLQAKKDAKGTDRQASRDARDAAKQKFKDDIAACKLLPEAEVDACVEQAAAAFKDSFKKTADEEADAAAEKISKGEAISACLGKAPDAEEQEPVVQ